MNKNSNKSKGSIHLYNPKEEGLGAYDVNYINAFKRNTRIGEGENENMIERYAA